MTYKKKISLRRNVKYSPIKKVNCHKITYRRTRRNITLKLVYGLFKYDKDSYILPRSRTVNLILSLSH